MAGDGNNKNGNNHNNKPDNNSNNGNNNNGNNNPNENNNINPGESSKKNSGKKKYIPMSELSDDSKEKRRASNRRKDEAKKQKKAMELSMLKDKDLPEEDRNAIRDKHNKAKTKAAVKTANWSAKTNYKKPYDPEAKHQYYENNKESALRYSAEYRKNHTEKIAEYYKNYRKKNVERIKDKQIDYRENNREKLRIDAKDSYWKHREERVGQKRKYNKENKELVNERNRIRYADDHNLWDNEKYWKNVEGIKFVKKK